jgi:hypothetical protein
MRRLGFREDGEVMIEGALFTRYRLTRDASRLT